MTSGRTSSAPRVHRAQRVDRESEPRALLSASGDVLESVDRLRNGRWISESTAAGGTRIASCVRSGVCRVAERGAP